MYVEGGIYLDVKSTTRKPFSEWLPTSGIAVFRCDGNCILNGFIFSNEPGHIVFKIVMDLIISNVERKSYGKSILDITGPLTFQRAINIYLQRPEEQHFGSGTFKDVHVLGQEKTVGGYDNYEFILSTLNEAVIKLRYPGYAIDKSKDINEYVSSWSKRDIFV